MNSGKQGYYFGTIPKLRWSEVEVRGSFKMPGGAVTATITSGSALFFIFWAMGLTLMPEGRISQLLQPDSLIALTGTMLTVMLTEISMMCTRETLPE